ncbi:MAG: hypothetical protein J6Y37_14095 [Paludibacteraceae bacterium]|nr:hypothetical protein [Paludibacteraceae bacterium]
MERDYEYVGYGTYTWDSDKFFKDLEKYTGAGFGFKKFTMKLKEDIWFNFDEVYNLQTQRMWENGIKDLGTDARLEEFADNFDTYFEKFSGKKWGDLNFYSKEDGLALSYEITDAYEEFLGKKLSKTAESVKTTSGVNSKGEICW